MTLGRITQRSLSDTALRGLQGSLGRVQRLQEQLSSGRRIERPSDDPAGTAAAMTFRSQRSASEQYLRNIEQASGRLASADTALTTLSDRFRAVRDLMVSSVSGAKSADSLSALATELSAVRSEVVDLYNTRYLNRPVFGGTVRGSVAVDPTTGAYLGDEQLVESRVSRDATVRIDVRGTEAGADVAPDLLDRIAQNVAAGGATPTDFADIDDLMSKVLRTLGDVGARGARIESTKAAVDAVRLDLTSRISESEEVDLPETIMNLQAQQVAYQAALGAAARSQQVSLVDYLR